MNEAPKDRTPVLRSLRGSDEQPKNAVFGLARALDILGHDQAYFCSCAWHTFAGENAPRWFPRSDLRRSILNEAEALP